MRYREVRHRKGFAIQLADRRERDLVQHDEMAGHHITGQFGRHFVTQSLGVQFGARGGQHIGDEYGRAGRSRPADGHRVFDLFVPGEHGIDLAEFDAQPADLDLEVAAAEVFQFEHVVGSDDPADHIAGSIHPFPGRAIRIRDEARRGHLESIEVAPCQRRTGQVQLTRDAHRYRAQPGIEHQIRRAADRPADGDRLPWQQFGGAGRADAEFGGAV